VQNTCRKFELEAPVARAVTARVVDLEEWRLLESVRRGETKAFARLTRRYHDQIRGVLTRRLGADPDLDDATQTVWIEVFRSIDRFEGRAKLGTWLTGIALNVARRHLRRRRLTRDRARPSVLDQEAAADTCALVEGREVSRRMRSILESLSPVRRDAFVAVELEGRSNAELAARWGVPSETVRTRLHCARRDFWQKAKSDPAFAGLGL
jgi:RNA polymerase sigma-70 factor (ECF subfamily)